MAPALATGGRFDWGLRHVGGGIIYIVVDSARWEGSALIFTLLRRRFGCFQHVGRGGAIAEAFTLCLIGSSVITSAHLGITVSKAG